jgi:RNA 2',3'-cyclic 3'-phosphodiesterase
MRLFTAVDLPAEIVRNLERLVDELRRAARIQWSPPGNMHVTTRFIGEWKDERRAELETALAGLASRQPIGIHVRKLGFFPNPHSPRVFWAGVDAPHLPALASDTDQALEPLGIPREGRPFSPHLTLARIKEPVPLQPLREAIAGMPSPDFGSFVASRFYLYQSQLGRGGSVYTKLAEFPLLKQ